MPLGLWVHTVLPATLVLTQVKAPRLNHSQKAGTRFTYPGEIERCVDLGYPAMHRQEVELTIFQSQVRHPNHYTTEPPY